MKTDFILLLVVTLVTAQSNALADTKPPLGDGFSEDLSPTCVKTCAEYKALGLCNAAWSGCNPAYPTETVAFFCEESCYVEPEPCSPNPCKNGGVCYDGVCHCSSGYSGTHCESCVGDSESGCKLQDTYLAEYANGGRTAFCRNCYSDAKKKCKEVEDCGGVTKEPYNDKEWTLRKGPSPEISTRGEISGLRCCFD